MGRDMSLAMDNPSPARISSRATLPDSARLGSSASARIVTHWCAANSLGHSSEAPKRAVVGAVSLRDTLGSCLSARHLSLPDDTGKVMGAGSWVASRVYYSRAATSAANGRYARPASTTRRCIAISVTGDLYARTALCETKQRLLMPCRSLGGWGTGRSDRQGTSRHPLTCRPPSSLPETVPPRTS